VLGLREVVFDALLRDEELVEVCQRARHHAQVVLDQREEREGGEDLARVDGMAEQRVGAEGHDGHQHGHAEERETHERGHPLLLAQLAELDRPQRRDLVDRGLLPAVLLEDADAVERLVDQHDAAVGVHHLAHPHALEDFPEPLVRGQAEDHHPGAEHARDAQQVDELGHGEGEPQRRHDHVVCHHPTLGEAARIGAHVVDDLADGLAPRAGQPRRLLKDHRHHRPLALHAADVVLDAALRHAPRGNHRAAKDGRGVGGADPERRVRGVPLDEPAQERGDGQLAGLLDDVEAEGPGVLRQEERHHDVLQQLLGRAALKDPGRGALRLHELGERAHAQRRGDGREVLVAELPRVPELQHREDPLVRPAAERAGLVPARERARADAALLEERVIVLILRRQLLVLLRALRHIGSGASRCMRACYGARGSSASRMRMHGFACSHATLTLPRYGPIGMPGMVHTPYVRFSDGPYE
jgi:hypothetical protein